MSDTAGEWISYAAASKILGVSPGTIRQLVINGDLVHRDTARQLPSIGRHSVLQLAATRRKQAEEAERKRQALREAKLPPQDGQVWLSVTTTAALIGVTPTRITQMIRREQMPATRKGHRWWIQRQHAEIIASARTHRLRQ